jgi:carbon monoxide dehydrogenase subunit G
MTTKVQKSITVDVPVSMAYNQWTQFEEFPQFMGGVQKVEQLNDRRLHWVAEIAGVKREWYAEILEQRQDEKVAWAASEGATNAGAVTFAPNGAGRTLVTLDLEYEPEGLVEKAGDALNIIERQATSDLEKFKTFIESRGHETGAWRGEVAGQAGTPGVEAAASSEGDSGKAGISAKAAAAGVAAVAGAAAVAAKKSGSSEGSEAEEAVIVTPPPEPDEVDVVVLDDAPRATTDPVAADDITALDDSAAGATGDDDRKLS